MRVLLTTCDHEDTQPVIRAIGVSHTACKDEFDKICDLTAGVYFDFYSNIMRSLSGVRGILCVVFKQAVR